MPPRSSPQPSLVIAIGLAAALAAACSDDKPKSAWPTDSPTTTKVPTLPEEERVDLYGDRLPSGAIARLGSVRMLDRKLGRAIFSADGSEIITSSEDSYLIWQTASAQRLGALEVADAAPAMAIRGDGKILATATYGGGIQLWDYQARKPTITLTGHRKVATALCFSGETLVSGSEDRALRIWTEGKPIELRGKWEQVSDVHCRPSGVVLFADDEGSVWLTDTSGAEPVRLLFAKEKESAGTAVTAVTMASDKGPFVAALADGTIAIWSAVKAAPIRFDAHKQRTLRVAFTSDGRLLSTGADAFFRFWDPATGAKTGERKAAADVEAQLFELSADGAFVVGFSELKDGRASEAGRFWLYDGKSGAQLLEPDRHRDGLTAIAFDSGGKKIVTASDDGLVLAWTTADASMLAPLARHKSSVRALERSGETWFSVGNDARMHASKIGGGDSIILEPLGGAIFALAVEPSGQRLVVGDFAGKVFSFSRRDGKRLARHDSEAFTTIYALAFSPDGKVFVIAGGNQHVHVVSAATGNKLTRLSPEGVVANYAVAFSADGKLLATGGDDHRVRLWSTATWQQVGELEGHDGTIRALAFSADGRRLASGASDEIARVWDVADRSEITLLAGHRGAVTGVAFSPDGKLLATASLDQTALVWELPVSADTADTADTAGTAGTAETPAAKDEAPAAKDASPAAKDASPAAKDAAPNNRDGAPPAPAKSDTASQ